LSSYVHLLYHIPHSNSFFLSFFFFNDPAPTEIYTLSLHDALPILRDLGDKRLPGEQSDARSVPDRDDRRHARHQQVLRGPRAERSEEHTSELQSRENLVCRLLLEKKKKKKKTTENKKKKDNISIHT